MTVSDTMSSLGAALASKYLLERELGRGGMATVYLARDLRHDRPVALKVLRPELGATLGPERFQREIHLAARLSHPNILPLFDSGETDGRLWYAMPYVQGESLRQRLGRESQLGVTEAVRITTQVAGALAYAHGQGIVHRDIKPENILLAGDQVLVADFGIAKALDASSAEKLTETGLSLGTPAYMSPEQAAGGGVDPRSDIYALGCVLYEMLAGTPPFTGPTAQAVMARHSVDPVPPLRTVRATIPWAVEQAVVQALAKVPADRFPTASEFAEALVSDVARRPRLRWPLSARATRAGLSIIAGAGVLGVAAWVLKERSIPAVVPSAGTIAVLPLVSTAADTGLVRLGRDFAVTVSVTLDGIGAIETADRLSIANATADRPNLSPGDGAALARRLGSSSILRGTLVRAGDNVRLDLGLYGTQGLAPVAEGITVSNHRDSIGALTDSVVWALLRQVWQRGKPPSPSLTAVTTRSLPALRSFLDGERHLERGWWQSAALAYRSAINADSSFWLAYFRYADARSWNHEEIEPAIVEVVLRHRNLLPERERILVEAYGDPGEWGDPDPYQELTRRFPEFWPAWFKLGDWLHHVGPLRGYTWKDAQDALGRAVALNPDLEPAWDHLYRNSVGWDTVQSRQALQRLEQVHSPDPATNNRAGVDPRFYRLCDALERSAGVLLPGDTAMADSIARLSMTPEATGFLTHLAPIGLLWSGNPAGQVEFNRRLIRVASDPGRAAPGHMGTGWAWAERGAWDSALAAMHRAAIGRPSQFAIQEYGLAVLGAWLGAVPPAEAAERRQPAARVATASVDADDRAQLLGTLAWLDGLLAFARRDPAGLTRAGADARGSGHPAARNIERSLAAFGRALDGDRGAAGRELAALERRCAERAQGCDIEAPNIAANRLAAATWLLEDGDTTQAAHLLTWHDAHIGPWHWSFVVAPLAFLMQGRIAEAWGDTASARVHYRQFLRRYDRPLPAQAHLVAETRAALARLSAGAGAAGDP